MFFGVVFLLYLIKLAAGKGFRHNSVVHFLAQALQYTNGYTMFADLRGFKYPSVITGNIYRPELLLSYSNDSLCVVELTVPAKKIFSRR